MAASEASAVDEGVEEEEVSVETAASMAAAEISSAAARIVDEVVGGNRDTEQALRPQHPQHHMAQRPDWMEASIPPRNVPQTRYLVSCWHGSFMLI